MIVLARTRLGCFKKGARRLLAGEPAVGFRCLSDGRTPRQRARLDAGYVGPRFGPGGFFRKIFSYEFTVLLNERDKAEPAHTIVCLCFAEMLAFGQAAGHTVQHSSNI